ncbi:MAG: Flp family type IVb pilin [Planctomycetota bacterium]
MVQKLIASASAFLNDEDGPTAVEYAVIVALIAGFIFTSVIAVGTAASTNFDAVTTIFAGS